MYWKPREAKRKNAVKISREAEREADDGVDVEAEAGRGDVENDEHPEGEDGPGEKGKHRDAAGGDEEERAIAGADDGSESDDAEDGEEDDAGDEFATAS